jgi:hypothetical protein
MERGGGSVQKAHPEGIFKRLYLATECGGREVQVARRRSETAMLGDPHKGNNAGESVHDTPDYSQMSDSVSVRGGLFRSRQGVFSYSTHPADWVGTQRASYEKRLRVIRRDVARGDRLYVGTSLGRKAAAEKAAKDLNELGFCDERADPITAARLEDWRDSIKRHGNSTGAKRFWYYVTKLKSVDQERAYEEILRSLRVIPGNRITDGPGGYS